MLKKNKTVMGVLYTKLQIMFMNERPITTNIEVVMMTTEFWCDPDSKLSRDSKLPNCSSSFAY